MFHDVVQAVAGAGLPEVLHVDVIPSVKDFPLGQSRLKHVVTWSGLQQFLPVAIEEGSQRLSGLKVLDRNVQERTATRGNAAC